MNILKDIFDKNQERHLLKNKDTAKLNIKEYKIIDKEKSFYRKMNGLSEYQDSVQISEGVKMETIEDYRYLALSHLEGEENYNEQKFSTQKLNFVAFLNKISLGKRVVRDSDELFENLCNIGTDFKKKLEDKNGISPFDLKINPLSTLIEKKPTTRSFTTTKKETKKLNEGGLSTNDKFADSEGLSKRYTYNSYVKNQKDKIPKNDQEKILLINLKYQQRKELYEINLVKKLELKYEKFKKDNRSVYVEFNEPYEKIMDKIKKLNKEISNYDLNLLIETKDEKLIELRSRATIIIIEFIKELKNKYEEKETSTKSKIKVRYFMWKKKFSELVNIWSLIETGSIDKRYKHQYLIIKYFLNKRATMKILNKEVFSVSDNSQSGGADKWLKEGLSLFKKDDSQPRMLFLQTYLLSIIHQLILTFILFYVLLTVPVRFFLKAENSTFLLLGKFIDMALYLDIFMNFRTSFKDKSNNTITDFNAIAAKYMKSFFLLDFFSSVPWSLFFIWNANLNLGFRLGAHFLKLFKILRLLPLLDKLEKLKAKNYVRLVKLIIIYFLIAHWMSCIIYLYMDSALQWNVLDIDCYTSNLLTNRNRLYVKNPCKYIFTFYQVNFLIPGQYTPYMNIVHKLNTADQYLIFIFEYILGYMVYAYAFGGVSSILNNLHQGQNIFTAKADLLRDHMNYYEVEEEIQQDIISYYDYLWLRHQDIIYGKSHFNLLTKSLRQKFETFNFIGNEVYLTKFYNLGNPKLVDEILINLKKIILFPYEILFDEYSITKGIYILLNGDIGLSNHKLEGVGKNYEFSIDYKQILINLEEQKKKAGKAELKHEERDVIFPFIPAFTKTGRNWQRCSSKDFTDLLFLPIEKFDQLLSDFPIEMMKLQKKYMEFAEKTKLFENHKLWELISLHSCRSIGKFYEKAYDKHTIWIPISVPLIQRKLDKNYIKSYVDRLKDIWREILVKGDINICLSSYILLSLLNSKTANSESNNNKPEENHIDEDEKIDEIKKMAYKIDEMISKWFE